MTILTNFKEYTPESPELKDLKDQLNVVFIRSDEGMDWYQAQKLFKPDLLKVIFDSETGVIIGTGTDITEMWPNGYSIADVEYDLNATPQSLQGKIFKKTTGKIVDRVYTKAQKKEIAQREIVSLQKEATRLMAPLQAAKDLDMMTEDETRYFKELQLYLVNLSRVVSQEGYPTKIEWPVLPTR